MAGWSTDCVGKLKEMRKMEGLNPGLGSCGPWHASSPAHFQWLLEFWSSDNLPCSVLQFSTSRVLDFLCLVEFQSFEEWEGYGVQALALIFANPSYAGTISFGHFYWQLHM